jgi:hypothetical protein
MKKQQIYEFYWFGTCLRFLQDTSEGYGINGDGGVLHNINEFFKYLKDLELHVTQRVANSKLKEIITELNSTDKDQTLSKDQAKKISDDIDVIRITLDAELAGVHAYTPTPKRLDLDRLLSDVNKLFSPGIFEALPDIARHDFTEAGKCIAFETPTAAAFHILRGTESVLRKYYEEMIRHKRIKSLMWGPIVIDLRKRSKTKPHEVLNNHLDNIRVSFRNPTQHPEAIYDIHEVQDLWSICVDVINRMVKILKDHGYA